MKWNRQYRIYAAGSVITLTLVMSGCSMFGASSSAQIDPPPPGIEQQMLQSLEAVDKTSMNMENALPATIYLENDHGLIAPVSIRLPEGDTADRLHQLLTTLIEDGPLSTLIPNGFSGVLPKGTQVEAVTVNKEEKMAIVEFNKQFGGYHAEDERKILEAITWTLTGESEVQSVQIWVGGEKLTEMPIGGIPLDRPLSRSLGINLQLGDTASLSNKSPVTVYFSAATPDGIQYFVPVTRFVEANQDPVQAALTQLIQGPSKKDGLERVLTDNTQLKGLEAKDGVITVSIQDDMFGTGEKLPAQMLQSLVLTVTENAKESKVRIQLNGQKEVVGMDNRNYSEPVTRPALINEIPL